MALADLKKQDDDEQDVQEQPDHAAPLRADIMGSMVHANPATPGYLGTLDHLITAHGAVEDTSTPKMGDKSTMGDIPLTTRQPDNLTGGPPPTMGPAKPQGWLGKIGHVAARMGNIAGDVLAPGAMLNIPGTDLNKRMEANRAELTRERQQKLATEEEAVKQRPELAAEKGAEQERLLNQKDVDAAKRQADELADKDKNLEATLASKEKTTAENNAAREKQIQLSNDTRKLIAKEHEAAETARASMKEAGANSRAAMAQDPNKLTNAMKTMKQQAQATLPEIDKAINETLAVKDLLGPEAGRWNDFIQGKIGISDPRFAHYRDEIHMVSTAVTLAHARGRMSNELFESFQKMFDAGKQSPENMIQALDVAQEWLTGYAEMGEGGAPSGGSKAAPVAGTVEGGYRFKGGDPANKNNWEKVTTK